MAGVRRGRRSSHAYDAESAEFGVIAGLAGFYVKMDQLSNGVGLLGPYEHRNNKDSTLFSPRFFNRFLSIPCPAFLTTHTDASVLFASNDCWGRLQSGRRRSQRH
jgi:hypothetical protein